MGGGSTPRPAGPHLRAARVSALGRGPAAVPRGAPPSCPPLPAVQRPRPGIPFLGGSPALRPAVCCCSLAPRQATWCRLPRRGAWSMKASGRAGRAGGGAGWLAALAACLAASLTGCQLAPRVLGPASLPCVSEGRGARDTTGERWSAGRWAAWAGCRSLARTPVRPQQPQEQVPTKPGQGWAFEGVRGQDGAAGGGQMWGTGPGPPPAGPHLSTGRPSLPRGGSWRGRGWGFLPPRGTAGGQGGNAAGGAAGTSGSEQSPVSRPLPPGLRGSPE